MRTRIRFLSCCLLLWLAPLAMSAVEKPLRIKPEEARQHVDKNVEVVFEVKGSKNSVKRKTVYLDSETDFNNEKNWGLPSRKRVWLR